MQAGYQSLMDGWKQTQDFWSNVARSFGGASNPWINQATSSEDSVKVVRELQEAALSVAQAWMRLPLALSGGASANELQEAASRLTEAQSRAYQLWLEALSRSGFSLPGTAPKSEEKKGT